MLISLHTHTHTHHFNHLSMTIFYPTPPLLHASLLWLVSVNSKGRRYGGCIAILSVVLISTEVRANLIHRLAHPLSHADIWHVLNQLSVNDAEPHPKLCVRVRNVGFFFFLLNFQTWWWARRELCEIVLFLWNLSLVLFSNWPNITELQRLTTRRADNVWQTNTCRLRDKVCACAPVLCTWQVSQKQNANKKQPFEITEQARIRAACISSLFALIFRK